MPNCISVWPSIYAPNNKLNVQISPFDPNKVKTIPLTRFDPPDLFSPLQNRIRQFTPQAKRIADAIISPITITNDRFTVDSIVFVPHYTRTSWIRTDYRVEFTMLFPELETISDSSFLCAIESTPSTFF